MIRPFISAFTTVDELPFDTHMSLLRASVKHDYKNLKQSWSSQDFAQNSKVQQAPIVLLLRVSARLHSSRDSLITAVKPFRCLQSIFSHCQSSCTCDSQNHFLQSRAANQTFSTIWSLLCSHYSLQLPVFLSFLLTMFAVLQIHFTKIWLSNFKNAILQQSESISFYFPLYFLLGRLLAATYVFP